jgi:hypothetical protein
LLSDIKMYREHNVKFINDQQAKSVYHYRVAETYVGLVDLLKK